MPVSALSMVGGFLCATKVIALDGDVLIWIYPVLCIVFGITHVLLSRRYGGSGCE